MRADHEEAWLSHIRRMLHGRIDILEANQAMRAERGEPVGELDLDALVASLAGKMGPGTQAPGPDVVDSPGWAARGGAPDRPRRFGRVQLHVRRRSRRARRDELREMEREVSTVRQRVHEVQDQLTAELARRYRSGEASPESALKGAP